MSGPPICAQCYAAEIPFCPNHEAMIWQRRRESNPFTALLGLEACDGTQDPHTLVVYSVALFWEDWQRRRESNPIGADIAVVHWKDARNHSGLLRRH